MLFQMIYLAIGASFIVSLSNYTRVEVPLYLKCFTPFLGVTLLVEGCGRYLVNHGHPTYILYNIFTSLEFLFYLYVLNCIINNSSLRLMIRYIQIFIALLAIVNILFIQTDRFTSITYSFGCLFIIFFSIYFFYDLFRNAEPANLTKNSSFWICLALLFYYCASFPLLGLTNFLSNIPLDVLNNLHTLLGVMNILLYTLFIIAFLCRGKTPKYTSQ